MNTHRILGAVLLFAGLLLTPQLAHAQGVNTHPPKVSADSYTLDAGLFGGDRDDDVGLPFMRAGDVVLAAVHVDGELLLRILSAAGSERVVVTSYAALQDAPEPETITITWWSGEKQIVIKLTPKGSEKPKDFVKRLTDYTDLLEAIYPPTKAPGTVAPPPPAAGGGSGGGGSGGGGSGGGQATSFAIPMRPLLVA